ncbi:MAG: DUF4912 domain-containing protein, partial [Thermoguttaceae bacterium]|nr:DUF4912 domain-containing protein [Thermoguttaceae bacterium]
VAKQLEQYTAKELGQMAKLQGIPGWHAMSKKSLIEALSSLNSKTDSKSPSGKESGSKKKKSASSKTSSSKSKSSKYNSNIEPELSARQIAASANISFNENGLTGSSVPVPGTPGAPGFTPPSMLRKITANSSVMDLNCELAQHSESDKKFSEQMKEEEDNLTLKARDAYWIQASWHIRQKTNDRVRSALGSDWHYAKPAIRLFEVRPNDGFNSRRALKNIEILLKAGNWFIDVEGVSASYQIELGYITENGKFFTVLTSNTVTTPSPDTVKGFDGGFDFDEALDEYELKMNFRLQSPSEEEYHVRQMIDDQRRKLGAAAFAKSAKMDKMSDFDDKGFPFHLDAKALIHGRTLPGAHVTVRGYPIIVDEDGEFLMRVDLPDRRQIFPVVASSGDGIQQRTIVLSLERVTRFLEPVYCMFDDEE